MSEETPLPSSSAPAGDPHREKSAASAVESDTNIESFDSEASSSDSAPSLAETEPPDTSFADDEATLVGDAAPSLEVIGDFEIHDKLGQGGMGSVYRARQISLDRWVALKILPASLEADDTFVTRFQREARIAASLNHRNLVRVYSSGQADGCHYIAMELVEGETLGQWLKRGGALPPPEALRVCLDVARALEAGWKNAHLIHRDIKPGNIFLSHDGEVKVGDLGLAKSMSSDTTGLTHTGTAMGTPHYISPEQARGDKDLDFRADIYSLGCTLYQMLTARTPYEGRDPVSVMHQHIHAPPPAILKVLPQCPIPLARLVGKMLKKIKRERQASYEELIAQIESVQALFAPAESPLESTLPPDPDATLLETPGAFATPRSATPVTAPVVRATAAPAKKKSPATLYAGIGVGALAIGITAFFLTSGKDSSSKSSVSGKSAVTAPTPAPVRWTNLIDLVDPARDGINGSWKIENGELISAKAAPWSICVLPVNNAPKNFDLRYRVTRGEGAGIGMFFPFRRDDETGGDVIFDYGSPNVPKWGGIEKFGGRRLTDTGSKRDMWLPKGQENTILVQVRDEGVAVQLNGEEVFRRTGDWSQIQQRGGVEDELFRKLGNRVVFGVGLFNSQATYHAIEMREVRGDEERTLPEAPKAPAKTIASNAGAENWQNVLRDDGRTLSLRSEARITSEGLRLGQNSSATIRVTAIRGVRDGGLRTRFIFDGGRPQLTARSNKAGAYNLAVQDTKRLSLTRYEAAKGTTILKELPLPTTLTPGESYELELTVVGSTLTAKFQGAAIGSIEDSTFTAGSFDFGNYASNAPEAVLQSIEFLDLDTQNSPSPSQGTMESWRDLFNGPVKVQPPDGAQFTAEGLEFSKPGTAWVGGRKSTLSRDEAVRIRLISESARPQLKITARTSAPGAYDLVFKDEATLAIQRHDNAAGKAIVLKQFPVSPPLTAGRSVELEFRLVGQRLTAKLDGIELGSVEDSALTEGGVGVSAFGNSKSVVTEYSYLDLDSPGAAAAAGEWKTIFSKHSPPPPGSNNSVEFRDGLLAVSRGSVLVPQPSANATIRARVRITEDTGYPALVLRSTGTDYYKFGVGRDRRSLGMTYFHGGNSYEVLGRQTFDALAVGSTVELEFQIVGSKIAASMDGRQVFTATDANLTAPGKWGISADAMASFESVEGRAWLPAAGPTSASNFRTENWQNVLNGNRGNFELRGGAEVTSQGLMLKSSATAMIRLGRSPHRDGAVRARMIFGEAHPQISARANDLGVYNVRIDDAKTISLLRWEGNTRQSQSLKQFSPQKPLTAGEAFELEVRMIGKTLTIMLDGVVLGSVEDGTIEAGQFAIASYGGSQLVEKLEFLDLDSANAEAWRELRSEPDNLELFRGAELTETGAKLPKSGYLLTRFDDKSIRDGAIRMKTAFGGPEIQARARSTERGGYSLHVSSATTVLLSRWDSKDAKRSDLKEFTLAKPLTDRQVYELELRVVGSELTAKLDGAVLGSVVDPTFASGRFGFGTSHTDSREATITAMQFLDLTGDKAGQAANSPGREAAKPTGAWKNLLTDDLLKVHGPEIVPEGLKMPKGSYAQTRFPPAVRDGAIRMKTVFGGPQLQLRARATNDGGYNFFVNSDGKTATLMRWDNAANKSNELLKLPLSQPLINGSALELELHAIGGNFSVKLNGTFLGTATDSTYGDGQFGVGRSSSDSRDALVNSLEFIEL